MIAGPAIISACTYIPDIHISQTSEVSKTSEVFLSKKTGLLPAKREQPCFHSNVHSASD